MIQIRGLVHQLDIGKTEEKHDNCHTVFVANGHHDGRDGTDYKNKIGIVAHRSNPIKAIIGKEKLGPNVEFIDPAVAPEPQDAQKHHPAEQNAKDRQWGGLYGGFYV